MTTDEKLQHFLEHCLEDAQHKSDTMLKEYSDALEKMFLEHQEDIKRQTDLRIQTETDRLNRECNKALAKEQISIKRILSKKHDELRDMLFVEVKDLLEHYMATPDYEKLLVHQIKKAKEFAGSEEITIYIDPADSDRLRSLETASGVKLTVSQYTFHGGTRAVVPSRKVLIDNSFETRLDEAKEKFRLDGGKTNG